jgi:hypothetical protein
MAAASRYAPNSPTAQLLRTSRLFSLPKPLPRPAARDSIRSTTYQDSPHATTPYPTHQAIATTHASRARGDWGLKRPLPIKTTAKAQTVRVKEHDTYDQVVEFEHAHDHSLTLTKLQGLNLAITRPDVSGTHYSVRAYHEPSAFEPQFDNVAIEPNFEVAEKTTSRESNLQSRWRRRGPSLGDMSEADFTNYLQNVRGKRDHFTRRLKWRAIQEFASLAREKANGLEPVAPKIYYSWLSQLSPRSLAEYARRVFGHSNIWQDSFPDAEIAQLRGSKEGEAMSLEHFAEPWFAEDTPADAKSLTMAQLKELENSLPKAVQDFWKQYWVNFRNKSGDDMSDRQMIDEFLDLPPNVPESEYDQTQKSSDLSTHPSAGLSYRRTDQTLNNNPTYGPLSFNQPQEARFLPLPAGARTTYMGKASDSAIGLDSIIISRERILAQSPTGITDERTPRGGQKLFVNVTGTHITQTGRINLEARVSGDAEQAIAQGKLQKAAADDQELEAARAQIESTPQLNPSSLPTEDVTGRSIQEPGSGEIKL